MVRSREISVQPDSPELTHAFNPLPINARTQTLPPRTIALTPTSNLPTPILTPTPTTLHSTLRFARPCPSPFASPPTSFSSLFPPSLARARIIPLPLRHHPTLPFPPKKHVSPPYRRPRPRDLLLPCHHPPPTGRPASRRRRRTSQLQYLVAHARRAPRGVLRGVQRQVRQVKPTSPSLRHPRRDQGSKMDLERRQTERRLVLPNAGPGRSTGANWVHIRL